MATIFFSRPFSESFTPVTEIVKRIVESHSHSLIQTSDEIHANEPVSSKIFRMIRDSVVVIADITGSRPNVLHEIGICQALGKPLVIITQDDPNDADFNIRTFQILRYNNNDLEGLGDLLEKAVSLVHSSTGTLRSMLVPSSLGIATQKSSPFVIAASPLSFGMTRGYRAEGLYTKLMPTSSDHVGIRGLYQAFGLLFEFGVMPESVNPDEYEDSVLDQERFNLYCIASPKSNRWTRSILQKLAGRGWRPRIEFRADPLSENLRNVDLMLFSDGVEFRPDGWNVNGDGDRHRRDYGLILRCPNPYHHNTMALVLAGRSSLGTEAACRAVVDPKILAEIAKRLQALHVNIEEHSEPFFALVSMCRDENRLPLVSTLTLEDVRRIVSA